MIRMYGSQGWCSLTLASHLYVHAVCFELFYNCTPVMRVEYELNTHLETHVRTCPVYESHTLTTVLIPCHVCFNSTIYRSSIFCAHESTWRIFLYSCLVCNCINVRSWSLHGQFIHHHLSCMCKHLTNISMLMLCECNCTCVRSWSLNQAVRYVWLVL